MGLLRKKPKDRPTAFEALQNKWVQAIEATVKS